jgi:hypothetical protein
MHRFRIGQRVFVPWAGAAAPIPSGTYVVVRLLPPVGGEPHYRVKSTADERHRALLESQLRPVPPQPSDATETVHPEGTAIPDRESMRRSNGNRPPARAQAAKLSTRPAKKKAAPEAPPSLGRKRPRKQTTGLKTELLRRKGRSA